MISGNQIKLVIALIVSILTFYLESYAAETLISIPVFSLSNIPTRQSDLRDKNAGRILEKLNADLHASIISGDTIKAKLLINSISRTLEHKNIDSLTISDSHYYTGIFYIVTGKNREGIKELKLALKIREQMKHTDAIRAKCLYNTGLAYFNMGDFKSMEQYTQRSFEIERKLYGESSPSLLISLLSLITSNYGLDDYFKAIDYGNQALKIINGMPKDFSRNSPRMNTDIISIYTNIGICYVKLSEYSKAVLFLEKAELLYDEFTIPNVEYYINLLNNLATTYFLMGLIDKSDEYFKKGFEMASSSSSMLSLNFINSFAIILGKAGKVNRGEELIKKSLEKVKNSSGPDSKDYYEILMYYADYLKEFGIDRKKSLLLFEQCIGYLNGHGEDISFRNKALLGYALALMENNESAKALERVQELIFSRVAGSPKYSETENPGLDLIEPNLVSLDMLSAKYMILWHIYRKSLDFDFLLAASRTSELIVALLDKVRVNISEEESRLILGDRNRDAYLFAIRDFDLCFKHTGNQVYWDKAFEYSEKSKVAGLLTSTRELKATQFHIPQNIADLERKFKSEIGFYNAKISEENARKSPDVNQLSKWKNTVLDATRRRDSLVRVFEKEYPEYYLQKYNTQVIKPNQIQTIAGRNINYLNYVLSDTVLYIFVTNRKYNKLIRVPIDTGFFNNINEFRSLLSMPSPLDDAKVEFIKFQQSGVRLYKTVLEPVRKYLISDKLLISTDNILSYVPFETIPMAMVPGAEINYRDLPYLMNEFSISYTYSATFMAESSKKGHSFSTSLIAFAPVYTGMINVDSLLLTRQGRFSGISDLQFARQEAEFVTDLTGGELRINEMATEAEFKALAGNYDIIHLAMHTILNDLDPMHSKMLFYQRKDSVEDGNLNTYEVYDIPLKAKMVMLSSCNTGSGLLRSGEGILSLARGFIYSGSQSVVMSMWEIEDRSGTEIVENFYRYLKRGKTKSNALRSARLDYLKNADMLRSHPYFWSALVIYGDNKPLYYSRYLIIFAGIILLIFLIIRVLHYYLSR